MKTSSESGSSPTSGRPGHSLEGFLRLVQLADPTLVVMVEGRQVDANFFGRVCEEVCNLRGTTYEIYTSDSIGGGGKPRLLALFERLRAIGGLDTITGGKRTAFLFFMDRDSDHFFGRLLSSAHINYTQHYCVENDLFLHGDLVTAIAAAASVDRRKLNKLLGTRPGLFQEISARLRRWVVLCLLSEHLGVHHRVRYHTVPEFDFDEERAEVALGEIADLAGISRSVARAQHDTLRDKVLELEAGGRIDTVLKGKWYPYMFDQLLRERLHGTNWQSAKFPQRLTAALLASLDFGAPWADVYRAGVARLL